MDNVIDHGIDKLIDYGIAITVLVLTLIAMAILVRYLLSRCDARFKESLEMHRDLSEKVTGVVEKNAVAITQLSEIIKGTR